MTNITERLDRMIEVVNAIVAEWERVLRMLDEVLAEGRAGR